MVLPLQAAQAHVASAALGFRLLKGGSLLCRTPEPQISSPHPQPTATVVCGAVPSPTVWECMSVKQYVVFVSNSS